MADIDQIIAGGAGSSSRADFSGIPKILDSYWAGLDQKQKNAERDVFKEGIPLNPDGTPNYGEAAKSLYQLGNVEKGTALSNLDIQRQQLKLGQDAAVALGRIEGGDQPQPNLPPSVNRPGGVVDQPPARPASRPQAAAPGGQPQTLMQVVAASGVPNDQLEAATASIARQIGMDPTQPINLQDPQVRNVLVPALQRLRGVGQPQGAPQAAPQAMPQQPPQVAQAQPQPQQPPPAAPQATPQAAINTRGSLPTENDPQIQQRAALYTAIMSNPAYPKSVQEAAKVRLEALQKNSELTGTQKEYAQARLQGFKGTLEDWQNRADSNTTQRDILTKSLLPKVDKSQESATAARDDINAIHRSREQLDQNGGVFSGAFGDKMLYLSKVAEALGVPNSDKITNTESYGAAIGQRVAVMVKAFGSGTAISDGDRKFAANMAGGQVTLDEKSMRRILDIGERAARGKIDNHNKLVDDVVGANDELKGARKSFIVTAPEAYKKAAASSGVFDAAREAIAKGAPREAVLKRLRDNGHDPAGL